MFLDSAQTAAFLYETFRITGVTRTGAGGQNVTLRFTSIAGVAYRVQKSANFAAGLWTDAGGRHGGGEWRRAEHHGAERRDGRRSREVLLPRGGGVEKWCGCPSRPGARKSPPLSEDYFEFAGLDAGGFAEAF